MNYEGSQQRIIRIDEALVKDQLSEVLREMVEKTLKTAAAHQGGEGPLQVKLMRGIGIIHKHGEVAG